MSKRRGRAGSIGSATRCRDSVILHLELGGQDPSSPFVLAADIPSGDDGWPVATRTTALSPPSALIIEGLDVRDRNAFFSLRNQGSLPLPVGERSRRNAERERRKKHG